MLCFAIWTGDLLPILTGKSFRRHGIGGINESRWLQNENIVMDSGDGGDFGVVAGEYL